MPHIHLPLVSGGKKLRDEIAIGILSAESQSKIKDGPQQRLGLRKCTIQKEMQIRVIWGSIVGHYGINHHQDSL